MKPELSTGPQSQKQLGNQAYRSKNYETALQHYQSYISTEHADNINAMLNIAACYYQLRQFRKGIEMCDQILDIDEKYYKCYYRRAMLRRGLLDGDRGDMGNWYRLMLDCEMFRKCVPQGEAAKEVEEFGAIIKECKEIITPSQPVKMTPFERSLIELEKENITMFALSELEERHRKHGPSPAQERRLRIDKLYKEMVAAKRELKDSEECKAVLDHIRSKIKELREQGKADKETKTETQTTVEQESVGETVLVPESQEVKVEVQDVVQPKVEVKESNQPKVQTESSQIEPEKEKKEEQTVKQIKQETEKLVKEVPLSVNSQMTAQQLFQTQIKQPLTSSRDAFQQFGHILTAILNQPDVSLETKAQLLKLIPKGLVDFKIMLMGMQKDSKAKLRETLVGLAFPEEIRKLYFPK